MKQEVAINGTYQVSGTNKITKDFFGFHADDGTVIDTLYAIVDGVETDITARVLEDKTAGLMANTLYRSDNSIQFSAIKLTSGRVNLMR
jgi:hypothetical protein